MSPRLRSTALALLLGLAGVACGDERPEAGPVTSTSLSPSTSTTVPATSWSSSTTAVRPSTTTPATAQPARTTTTASLRPALPAGWERCTDRARGYAVGRPGDWHTLRLEMGDCHFFDPMPIVAPPNSDGIVTWMSAFVQDVPRRSFTGPDAIDNSNHRILSARDVTMGSRTMLLRESVTKEELILPAGTRLYGYFLDCGTGSVLLSTTQVPGRPESEYAAKKAVVDRAAPTLECLG